MKICTNCQIEKPLTSFYKEKGTKDGHRNECKACRNAKVQERRKANPAEYNQYMREWREKNPDLVKAIENKRYQNPERKAYAKQWSKQQKESGYEIYRLYGITKEQRFEMLKAQDGKCAVCKKHEAELKRGLFIDHCHNSKKVRGLLCDSCNKMLGHAKDNIEILQKAIEYLKK